VDHLYLATWFPRWQRLSAALTAPVGPSLTLVLLGALLTSLAAFAVWGVWAPLGRRALGRLAAWSAAVLVLWFPLGFGLAYRAGTLEAAVAGLREPSAEAARDWLLDALVAAAAALPSGPGALPGAGAPEVGAAAARCVAATAADLRAGLLPDTASPAGLSAGPAVRVKELPAGTLLRFGYAGVVSPWLLEPHVDGGLPPVAALGVALHELAHVAGFAREAEAEAVAHLAGITCDDAWVRYAATLRLAGRLSAVLDEGAARAFVSAWPARAVADTRAAGEAVARFESPGLRRATDAAYDAYLRAQGSSDGLAGYDRGTRLGLVLLYRAVPSVGAGGGDPGPSP